MTPGSGSPSVGQYEAELWDCQIGFDWRGCGYLTHRLIEYIRAGVVPITCPFGEEWPVREDVVLEDGVHGIFCSDPKDFAREAKSLLRDPAKIRQIRRHLLDLWQEKPLPRRRVVGFEKAKSGAGSASSRGR